MTATRSRAAALVDSKGENRIAPPWVSPKAKVRVLPHGNSLPMGDVGLSLREDSGLPLTMAMSPFVVDQNYGERNLYKPWSRLALSPSGRRLG